MWPPKGFFQRDIIKLNLRQRLGKGVTMEIMLNGQLVSCTPKEYKELMDMGFISNQHSVATQSTQVYPGNIPVLPDSINQLPETSLRVEDVFNETR